MRICYLTFFCIFTFASCQVGRFEKLNDGIIVHIGKHDKNGAKTLRLKVVSAKIIHVIATPSDSFSNEKSLIIIDNIPAFVKWNVTEKADSVLLQTKAIKAIVSLKTGEICFTDSVGNHILTENKEGGKSITRSKVVDKAYEIRQVNQILKKLFTV